MYETRVGKLAPSNGLVTSCLETAVPGTILVLSTKEEDAEKGDNEKEGDKFKASAPPTLYRSASNYGFIETIFRSDKRYLVVESYNKRLETSQTGEPLELHMLVVVPLNEKGLKEDSNGEDRNEEDSEQKTSIVTWLVDRSGWIRVAEDYAPRARLTSAAIQGRYQDGAISILDRGCHKKASIIAKVDGVGAFVVPFM
jgi:hypothetical protein